MGYRPQGSQRMALQLQTESRSQAQYANAHPQRNQLPPVLAHRQLRDCHCGGACNKQRGGRQRPAPIGQCGPGWWTNLGCHRDMHMRKHQ